MHVVLCIKTSCICDATARLPSLLLATASVNIGCGTAGTCVRPEAVLWQDAVGVLAQLLAKGAVLHSLCTTAGSGRHVPEQVSGCATKLQRNCVLLMRLPTHIQAMARQSNT